MSGRYSWSSLLQLLLVLFAFSKCGRLFPALGCSLVLSHTHHKNLFLCLRGSFFFHLEDKDVFRCGKGGLLYLPIQDCVTFLCLPMLQNVRVQLQESLPGTRGGKNSRDELLVKFLYLLPLLLIAFCYYRSFLQVGDFKKS